MITLKMLIVFGALLVLGSPTVYANGSDCDTGNSTTVSHGTVTYNSGCRKEVCDNGTLTKEKICPEGFTLVNFGGVRTTCLMIIKKRMDWKSAQQACSQYSQDEKGIGEARLFEAPNADKFAEVLAFAEDCVDDTIPLGFSTTTETNTYTTQGSATTYQVPGGLRRIEPQLPNLDEFESTLRMSANGLSPCGKDFYCANGNQCAAGKPCDGVTTCMDGTDEKYCFGECEFWAGADNSAAMNEIAWLASHTKVDGVMPKKKGRCLGIVDGQKKVFDCNFEGLYPLCEVCASTFKAETGCQYNKKLVKEGKVADRLDCALLKCVKNKIVEEPLCPPGYERRVFGESEGCYMLIKGNFTREDADNECKGGMALGLKRRASRASDDEMEAITNFIEEKGAASMDVWVDIEGTDACSYTHDGEMEIIEDEEDCANKTASVLCEACHTEGDQDDGSTAESEKEGCLYMGTMFDIGDQIYPNSTHCYALVCVGPDNFEQKYFGDGCCETEDGVLLEQGPTPDDMPVPEGDNYNCKRVLCIDGVITTTEITCGCKSETGATTYTHGQVISINKDPKVCKKEVCENGTINEYPLPPSDCPVETCTEGGKTYKVNQQICVWTNKKKSICKIGKCQSTGNVTYVKKTGKQCKSRNAKKWGCK